MDASVAAYELKTKEEVLCAFQKLEGAFFPNDVLSPENLPGYAEKLAKYSYVFVGGPAEKGDDYDVFTDEVMGLVAFYANDPKTKNAHATFLATSPNHRRKGIGSGLMEVAIETALENGMETMTLEVHKDNEIIQKLHGKRGFVVDAEIPGDHYRMFMRLVEDKA